METIGPALAGLLAGGLTFPRVAAGAGLVYIIGRELYASGYAAGGPRGRRGGSIAADVGLLGLILTAILGGVQLAGLAKIA